MSCDDEDVVRAHAALLALLVPEALLEEIHVYRLDELRFLREALAVAVVLDRDEGDAGRLQGGWARESRSRV